MRKFFCKYITRVSSHVTGILFVFVLFFIKYTNNLFEIMITTFKITYKFALLNNAIVKYNNMGKRYFSNDVGNGINKGEYKRKRTVKVKKEEAVQDTARKHKRKRTVKVKKEEAVQDTARKHVDSRKLKGLSEFSGKFVESLPIYLTNFPKLFRKGKGKGAEKKKENLCH